jgi:hypothetical protein
LLEASLGAQRCQVKMEGIMTERVVEDIIE